MTQPLKVKTLTGATVEVSLENWVETIINKSLSAQAALYGKLTDEKIQTHLKTCPVGIEFKVGKAKLWGLLTGLTIGSGTAGGLIGAILTGVLGG